MALIGYARVSTKETTSRKAQHVENQEIRLREYEVPRGFRTVHQLGWTIWKGEVFAPT
jgi:DNA invertase Pin-like site-specific DNA recombinase